MAFYMIVNVAIVVVLGLLVRFFGGKDVTEKGGWDFQYSSRDIVILAVIAAISGVVNTGLSQLWDLANTSLGPLGGALIQGTFMWSYVLAMWVVRKPGAALAIGLIGTAIQVVSGNPAGIASTGWGVTQGLAIEVVMALGNYRKYSFLAALLAAAASSQFGTVWTAILYGWDPAEASDVWLAVPVNLLSGLVVSGIVGFWLARAIRRSGLVRAAA